MSRARGAQGAESTTAERTGRYVSTGAQPQRCDRLAQQCPDRLLAMWRGLLWLVLLVLAGCVDSFKGTYVHMDLVGIRPPCDMEQALGLALPKSWQACPSNQQDRRLVRHYELWATVHRSSVVRLAAFTVQAAVDLGEELELEQRNTRLSQGDPFYVADGRPFAELSPGQQQLVQTNAVAASQLFAITSYAKERFLADGVTLQGDLYVGNALELTRPLNGYYWGRVQGQASTGATVGGAVLRSPVAVAGDALDSLMITIEDGPINRDSRTPSTVHVVAGPAEHVANGVINVVAVNPAAPTIAANFAIYEQLDQDDYF